MSNRYTSIPDPQPTVESLLDTVRALKATVEVLTGAARGSSAGSPLVFVQTTKPQQNRGFLQNGDLWIDTSISPTVLRYWTGERWASFV